MTSHHQKICCLQLAALFALGTSSFAAVLNERDSQSKQLASYQEQYGKLAKQYAGKLIQLAATAEAAGFAEDAKTIRALAVPFDPAKIQSGNLPRKVQPELPFTLPKAESWRLTLREVREKQATDLYLLSRRLLTVGFPSAAYRLVREVTLANPDHVYAQDLGISAVGR